MIGRDYPVMYFFTGMIYEYVDYDLVSYVIRDYLIELGVAADDCSPRYINGYMAEVRNRVKDHVLRPDMSVMCFENCVVDFNTMKVYGHSPLFDCMKVYPFRYDRREIMNCPVWRRFLGESMLKDEQDEGVLPEKYKRRVLQMFLGACLMDRKHISFEYFLILQGSGANGKSVIYRVLKDMFGEEEILNIKLSQFSDGGDGSLRAAFSMKGKRLLYCTESTRGDFKDMSMIKQISSGEPVSCREIGGNVTSVQRPPILLCNSNYKWKASDFLNRNDPYDESMQRRAVILNFEKTIPVENRDTLLAEKMRKEHAGIFAWIVKGLVELRRNNYRIPENLSGRIDAKLERIRSTVTGADGARIDGSVSEYMIYKGCSAESREGLFKCRMRASDMFGNYQQFCKKNGVVSVSKPKFGRDLVNMGYRRSVSGDTSHLIEYTFWCEAEEVANDFCYDVPSIAEASKSRIFEGVEMSDGEFISL
jgi:phage/plasmid-associated DNA primase